MIKDSLAVELIKLTCSIAEMPGDGNRAIELWHDQPDLYMYRHHFEHICGGMRISQLHN